MGKTILKFFCLFAAAILGSSCQEHTAKYTIGVSQFIHDQWRDKFIDEIRIGTYNYDNVGLEIEYANGDARKQSSQIEQMIRSGVDLIIVAPETVNDLSDAIDKAMGSGIPVIVFGRTPEAVSCTAFVVADYYDAGYSMGEYICQMLNMSGNIVEIKGMAGSQSAIERHKGFIDAISKYNNIHLLASEPGDWSVKSGEKAIESLGRTLEDVDVVFGANDKEAYGAYRQVKRMGVKKNILFCGMDGLSGPGGGMNMVKDGILTASCINPTHGVEVVQLAMDILEGRKYKRENYQTPALVTKDNATVLLMQQKELQAQIKDLNTLQHKRESAMKNVNMLNFYLILMGVLVALLLFFIVTALVGYYNKVKLNRKLSESNLRQQQLTAEIQDLTKKQLQFFTNVSHELRTPLTLISAPVEQLYSDNQMPEKYRRTIQIIHKNVNLLVHQINEILDFRRIQNNKAKLQLNKFNLAVDLKDWSTNFMAVADIKGIALEFDMEDSGSGEILADRDKIAHIYFNLMSNAIKYTPSGGRITTRLKKWNDDGNEAYRLSVEDTGIGMTKETVEHIFERFYQAYDENGGTGIGLHLTKAYIDMHNGKVTVESEIGKGACFHIILPAHIASYEEISDNNKEIKYEIIAEQYLDKGIDNNENMDSILNPSSEEKYTVLVIDDNHDMREYLKLMLSNSFDVVEACDGATGLSKAKKIVPSVIISDIMMPVMDGMELCQKLKSSTITSHIPVILLTAKNVDNSKTEGYLCGADSYITKPFTTEMLIARIHNLLKSREVLQKYFTESLDKTTTLAPVRNKELPFVIQLRDIIQRRMKEPNLSVEDLGEELHLSRVQLYRKIKALTGNSPAEIIKKSRLNYAKLLLETTDKTVSEIMYEVGFTNSSYFAKCYKETFNKTPSEEKMGKDQ